MKMQTNLEEIMYLPLQIEETNRQNSDIDNSSNDHGDRFTSEVHNTIDQRVRQPMFKYLLMADIECISIGFTRKSNCGYTKV